MSWYKEGLSFKCTGCGACCTGSPGYVWVTDEECRRMATKLNLSFDIFCRRYTRLVFGRRSLLEHPVTYDCVFLQDKRCTLYEARPKQCRTFPWWKENLRSKQSWESAGKGCEGIDHPDAPLIRFEEIQKHLDD